MPRGQVTALFLFDIADAIDLDAVNRHVAETARAPLSTRPATPPYLQYAHPPVVIDGSAIGVPDAHGFRVRFKTFDYGVISVALTRPLPDTWPELLEAGIGWQESSLLAADAESLCRQLLDRLAAAVSARREAFLSEDYLVFTIHPDAEIPDATRLLATHGRDIAQLLRGERDRLSDQEHDHVLGHRISYYETDAVIPTWSSALVYDTEAGARGALEILEFANSQLLEFRYYDHLLDAELARIYGRLQSTGWRQTLVGRRYIRAARQVHAFFIDVNELTDKTENALKIAGDVYAARLFGLAATRLGLDRWKANVHEKLKTLDDIYRFAVEHTGMARGEFLEVTVVLLIVLEIVLLALGVG
ncbi:MAG TPA: hypothetical protein VL173_17315 [Vicinamibacterales bacterium]|jgi:hypothetical protein|nr:hypothetical protein [Vicinamibacterales bacterium]